MTTPAPVVQPAPAPRLAPVAPRLAPGPSRWVRWIDQVSAWLPILLMGTLAAGTYWLVKNTPVPDAPRAQAAPRHEPDYTMKGFSVQHFTAQGRPNAFIEGREMRHYPDTDTLEIDQVRLRSVDESGRTMRASALKALSNGDGSEVQLMGEARIVREPFGQPGSPEAERLEFEGEFLHVFTEQERVVSHLPVQFRQGTAQISGQSLRYDNLQRVLELQGQVRGSLPARGTRVARP